MAAATALIEQNPRSEIGLALMGFAYSNQGDMDTAIEYLDRALAIMRRTMGMRSGERSSCRTTAPRPISRSSRRCEEIGGT